MTTYDRRTFLRRAGLAGAAGAAIALVPGVARPQARPDDCLAPFLHGVASGDPTGDGVLLWTRVRDEADPSRAVDVRWTVATDVDLTDVVASGTTTATAARDHTVRVDVDGLEPGTHYFYAFDALGVRSLTGRTKTAAADGTTHVRFGVVSCSSYQHGWFNAYARLAERNDLDAILHLGDYIYEYGPGEYGDGAAFPAPEVREHQPPNETLTLADYRGRHAHYKLDPDLRRLHQLFPFITTWDDHESADNSWRDGANEHDAGEGVWAERKAWAQQAYDEWMPIRSESPDRIHRTLRYGDLCDLIYLDTRLEGRDEQLGGLGTTILEADIDDPDRRIMSAGQMAWFQDELTASQARGTRWRLVAQQVCVGQWNLVGLPDELLGIPLPDVPELGLRDDGNGLNPDSWDGYTADRERFLDHVRDDEIDNVVVLTGDVHSSWAMELATNPASLPYTPVGVEFVAPAVTSPGLETTFGEAAPVFSQLIGNPVINPHIKYVDLSGNGYLVLDVTPERVQSDWYFVDTVLEPSAGESRAASWAVEDGSPTLVVAGTAAAPGPIDAAIPDAEPASCAPAPPPAANPTAPAGPAPASGQLPATGGTPATTDLALPVVAALGVAGAVHALRRRQLSDGSSG